MVDLNWEVPGAAAGHMSVEIACAVAGEARRLVHEQMSDLREMFPLDQKFQFHGYFDPGGWFGLRMIFDAAMTMIVGPKMEEKDIEFLRGRIIGAGLPSTGDLQALLGEAWFGPDRFTYVGPYQGNRVSWSDISTHLLAWLNASVVPDVLLRNRKRVLRAVPQPPEYDVRAVMDSLWVLECEQECIQGTAFSLEDVGLMTCEHVIGRATIAFRHSRPEKRFPVRVIARHAVLDLAVLEVDSTSPRMLKRGDASRLAHMDHLLVAGHPDYRLGDSPLVAPGLVAGFRQVSGIRRILTNAPIVAGGSGGPVLDRNGTVVGVAVTGAERLGVVSETEDLGIVPIDALDILLEE